MLLLQSRGLIARLAARIESAYLRRRPRHASRGIDPCVWTAAASHLVELHRGDPGLPVDPELFVAAQDGESFTGDPWHDLTRAAAVRRYRASLRRIVKQLRAELRDEVRHGERRLRRGTSIDALLSQRDDRLSPLGRYILACRLDRMDLASRHQSAARSQHRACPLYRAAAAGLLPASKAYPVLEGPIEDDAHESARAPHSMGSLN